MLVHRANGSLRLITQSDRAALAVRLLSLWLLDGVPQHPRRAEILTATRDHELGWQGADAAPALNAEGRPCTPNELPISARLEIWNQTLDRSEGRGWVGLVIGSLLRNAVCEQGPEVDQMLVRLERSQDQALEALSDASGRSIDRLRAELGEDVQLIRTVACLATLACDDAATAPPLPLRVALTGSGLGLAPFPLAGPTTLRVAARWIEDRPYRAVTDLVGALGQARWGTLDVLVEPLASDAAASSPAC